MEGYVEIGKFDFDADKLCNLHRLSDVSQKVRGFLYKDGTLYANTDELSDEDRAAITAYIPTMLALPKPKPKLSIEDLQAQLKALSDKVDGKP